MKNNYSQRIIVFFIKVTCVVGILVNARALIILEKKENVAIENKCLDFVVM